MATADTAKSMAEATAADAAATAEASYLKKGVIAFCNLAKDFARVGCC